MAERTKKINGGVSEPPTVYFSYCVRGNDSVWSDMTFILRKWGVGGSKGTAVGSTLILGAKMMMAEK